MKKRQFAAVFCLLLTLATVANAEMITITPKFYDLANDIADWHLTMQDLSDDEIQALRRGTFHANLLPIRDDLLLWYGRFEYHDLVKEESFWLSYDVEMPRSDAYAVAVDKEGNRLWSLRLSDPQSENGFGSAYLLKDGRIMLQFIDRVGEFGTQYYIVSLEGELQEMLPAYKAKEYGVYEMLQPMHDGFFGGGMQVDQDAFGAMYNGANFTYFDDALDMRWRNESEEYAAGFMEAREATDGILIGGSVYLNYIPNLPYLNQAPQPVPIASKLDLEGNTLWTYTGHELCTGSLRPLFETKDGGAVFLTQFDPTVPTAFDVQEKATLVKFSGKGELEWVKQMEAYGFYGIPDVVPYGDGYLVAGCRYADDDTVSNLVFYVSEDFELLKSALVDVGEPTAANFYAYITFVSAPDGDVYLYGATVASEGVLAGMDNPQHFRPFYLNMRDVF